MIDTDDIPVVLAGIGVVSAVAFVVGAAGVAATYGGLWAAVTVASFLLSIVAAALLYAVGEMERNGRNRERGF